MEFDAVKPDAPTTTDQLIDYWRERAECLEEWVCELLRKNQALRMGIEMNCPTRQCAEIRKSVFQFAISNEFVPAANN
jgi:hypothetical protein